MSSVCMTLTQSSGTWLKGCLQPQHYYVSLSIDDPDGKILARVALSYEQAARMLLYNGDVECTLEKYRDIKGELVEEEVKPPETVHQRMKDRLGETHSELSKRLEDVKRDVKDMINGITKPGKKSLMDLLNDIDTIQSHYGTNETFVVQQAEEELSAMQSNAAGQLGVFLQTKGLELAKEDLVKMIPAGVPEDRPKMLVAPVAAPYELKDRPERALGEMTTMEIAEEMSSILSHLEAQCDGSDKADLFHSNAKEVHGNKVSVRYIGYQGSTSLDVEDARDYLKFLRTVKDIKGFKTHYWYKGK